MSAVMLSSKTRNPQSQGATRHGTDFGKLAARRPAPEIRELYRQFFGDRDPVAKPGTATGTPGDYWTTFALVAPTCSSRRAIR